MTFALKSVSNNRTTRFRLQQTGLIDLIESLTNSIDSTESLRAPTD